MDVPEILNAIDSRIAALQQARNLLSTTAVPATEKRAKAAVAAIQPKAAKGKAAKAPAKAANGRKPMSEEGRARIAAAQKKRWALKNAETSGTKKPATKKSAAKKSAVKKAATEPAASEPSAE